MIECVGDLCGDTADHLAHLSKSVGDLDTRDLRSGKLDAEPAVGEPALGALDHRDQQMDTGGTRLLALGQGIGTSDDLGPTNRLVERVALLAQLLFETRAQACRVTVEVRRSLLMERTEQRPGKIIRAGEDPPLSERMLARDGQGGDTLSRSFDGGRIGGSLLAHTYSSLLRLWEPLSGKRCDRQPRTGATAPHPSLTSGTRGRVSGYADQSH